MLDAVTAAAVKMAAPAGLSARCPNLACDLAQINRRKNFFTEFSLRIGGISASGRKFAIGSGGIVTNQTVDILRGSKIKIFIFPAVTGMTAGAPAPV